MLIWGYGGDCVNLWLTENRYCLTCEKERSLKVFLQYRYSHFWYVFKWVSEKHYIVICDVCQQSMELVDTKDIKKIKASLKTNPIAWGTRYGWTFLVGLIALGILSGVYSSYESKEKDHVYIDAPQVNDLYVVNLAKATNKTDTKYKYGIIKVQGLDENEMILKVSKLVYNKVSGPTDDISSGKATKDDYYEEGTISMLKNQIKSMRDDGSIESVHRP